MAVSDLREPIVEGTPERRAKAFEIAEMIDEDIEQIRSIGCRARIHVVDDFSPDDGETVLYLIGTDEQMAASYLDHHRPDEMSVVTRIQSLEKDTLVGEMVTSLGDYRCVHKISEGIYFAINMLKDTIKHGATPQRAEELSIADVRERIAKATSVTLQSPVNAPVLEA